MKNYKLILIFGIFITFAASCSSTKFISREDKIELVGNPTTGYTWNYSVSDEAIIQAIIQIEEKITYLGKKGITGAPSQFVYKIHSLKAGKAEIKFEYKRPWETNPAEEVRTYNVTVDENGKMKISEIINEAVKTFKTISMEEGLKLMSEDSDFILLDVRTPEEFAEGHIPGAVQLTNETFTKEDAEKIIPDKNKTIYCYCRSGRRVLNSCQKLIDFGYTNVINIGGIIYYKGKIEK